MNTPPRNLLGRARDLLCTWPARLLLGGGLLVWLLSLVDWRNAAIALRQIPPGFVAVQLLLFYAAQGLASQRWRLLLRMHGVTIRWWHAVRLNFLGIFTSCFLPGSVGGDAIKVAVLARESHALGRILISVLVDRLTNTLVVTLTACVMLPRMVALLPGRFQWPAGYWLLLGSLMAAAGVVAVVVAYRCLPALSRRRSLAPGLASHLQKIHTALTAWRDHPAIFAAAAGISLLMLIASSAGAYLLLRGLQAPVAYLDFLSVMLALHFVAILPISLNGVGVADVSLVVLLEALGVPRSTGVAFAILTRVLYLLAVTPGAATYLHHRRTARIPATSGESGSGGDNCAATR